MRPFGERVDRGVLDSVNGIHNLRVDSQFSKKPLQGGQRKSYGYNDFLRKPPFCVLLYTAKRQKSKEHNDLVQNRTPSLCLVHYELQ